jgi:sirohydrochlorin cobaltochelatase
MSAHGYTSAFQRDHGLLLVGHGSREQPGVDELLATAGLVAQMAGESPLESCFLEFARPTIADGFRALAARNVRRIVAVPVMLFAAGHAKRDIPAALAAVAAEYPQIAFAQAEHLGCHPDLLALSKLRYVEALRPRADVAAHQTACVIVGRGSRDPLATAEMLRFVQLRTEMAPVANAWACFLSMAEPSLEDVLDAAASCGANRIVVQPHLLFDGVLSDRLKDTVDRYARRHPQAEWLVAAHLGASAPLAEAILDRASRVIARSGGV